MTAASFDVLATLRRAGPPYALSPGALALSTMVTSGTMTNRIDQLAKTGLVKRIRNPDDGRGFHISLTDLGLGVIDAAIGDHVTTQHRLVSDLAPEQRNDLNAGLKDLLRTFETPD
ncbi:MAG: MarR family transcriptional regulator [Rhodobacteraceae bacterium]|nr:MarR family transcriptional regulator [Paracoccaceae bacterium]